MQILSVIGVLSDLAQIDQRLVEHLLRRFELGFRHGCLAGSVDHFGHPGLDQGAGA